MPRTAHTSTPTRWNIIIPHHIASRIDTLLHDPHTNRTKYGERSKLITTLLSAYLYSLEKNTTTATTTNTFTSIGEILSRTKAPTTPKAPTT